RPIRIARWWRAGVSDRQEYVRCNAGRGRPASIGCMTTAAIRKPNMIEFNPAWAFSTLCDRRRRNLHWGIKQLEDAFARCHRRLQNVVLLAEVLNGPEEALRV